MRNDNSNLRRMHPPGNMSHRTDCPNCAHCGSLKKHIVFPFYSNEIYHGSELWFIYIDLFKRYVSDKDPN